MRGAISGSRLEGWVRGRVARGATLRSPDRRLTGNLDRRIFLIYLFVYSWSERNGKMGSLLTTTGINKADPPRVARRAPGKLGLFFSLELSPPITHAIAAGNTFIFGEKIFSIAIVLSALFAAHGGASIMIIATMGEIYGPPMLFSSLKPLLSSIRTLLHFIRDFYVYCSQSQFLINNKIRDSKKIESSMKAQTTNGCLKQFCFRKCLASPKIIGKRSQNN